jgi:hypothetical protein
LESFFFSSAEVALAQSLLRDLSSDLNNVTKILLDVKNLFLDEKIKLDQFKATCTTPLFCDRIDSDALVAPVEARQVMRSDIDGFNFYGFNKI